MRASTAVKRLSREPYAPSSARACQSAVSVYVCSKDESKMTTEDDSLILCPFLNASEKCIYFVERFRCRSFSGVVGGCGVFMMVCIRVRSAFTAWILKFRER